MTQLTTSDIPVCVIVGAGPGNGAAFARRFAAAGYRVALLARDLERLSNLTETIPNGQAIACNVSDSASVRSAFETILHDLGRIGVLVYNAGKGIWGGALSIAEEDFESAWKNNTLVRVTCLADGSVARLSSGTTAMQTSADILSRNAR